MLDVLTCMAKDFAEPLPQLVTGICYSAALTMAYSHFRPEEWYRRSRSRRNKKRLLKLFVFLVYGYMVLWIALFSRPPGSRLGVDLGLFDTWGSSARSKAYVLENIVMTIPLGMMLPMLWKWAGRASACVGAGLLVSGTIEILQYISQRGFMQVDDLITNGVGTLMGWCIWRFFLRNW